MARTTVSCPNCRQPVAAEIEQLFDLNTDPAAKQRLLSGAVNMLRCPSCGYQGSLATPLVYHDPDKELLLTFVPGELGLPRNEQERLIGNMMNQVINKLPQEKRKGYLLRPQETLTMQGLVERVLEADGITREMIQAQQQRLNLVQRLANISDKEALAEVVAQEEALIDGDFFNLISRLAEAAMVSGDQASARRLGELQRDLLPLTEFGRQVQSQSQEIEAAVNELQAAGEGLTREMLLDMVVNAPNETRLQALVSLARQGMDYEFFQLLSQRIDRARGDGRERLVELRGKLLEMTQAIDKRLEAHIQQVHQLIDAILKAPDVRSAMMQSLQVVDDYFLHELEHMQQEARASGDLERSGKIGQMMEVIQEASAPPQMALVEEYLDAADDAQRVEWLNGHAGEIDDEFVELMANIVAQVQASDDQEMKDHVVAANRQVIRFNMQRNLRAG